MQIQSHSPAAGMQFPSSAANPATAVSQTYAQPAAADSMLSEATTTVGQSNAQPAAAASIAESNSLANSSAALPTTVASAEQAPAAPADLTGIVTTVGSITSQDAEQLRLAMQPSVQPADLTGIISTAQSTTGQDTQQPSMQSAQGSNKLQSSLQPVGEPVRGLADPNKRLLAKMGSQAASDVSKQLLQEVAARSHVEGLLQVSTSLWQQLLDIIGSATMQDASASATGAPGAIAAYYGGFGS